MFAPNNAGFRLTFKNGWSVSVQWHAGSYSHKTASGTAKNAEIAVIDPDGNFLNDDVIPYASPDAVAQIIAQTAAR